MKGLAIAWTMLVAVAIIVLGMWFISTTSFWIPSILALGSGGFLFVMGVMLIRDYR